MDTVITVIIILSVVSIVAICICLCIFCRKYFIRRNYEVLEQFPLGKCKCLRGKTCPYDIDDYELGECFPLGYNNYGAIYKATRKADYKNYAVKVFKSYPGSVKTEEKILKKAVLDNAKNIIRLYHVFKNYGKIYFIMELCSTDLEAIAMHQHLYVNRIKKYFRMIIRGLEYLHDKQGYVHCDLKPKNILIASDDTVRISNFKSCLEPYEYKDESIIATLIKPPGFDYKSRIGFDLDSWQVGLALIYVCCGPYPENLNPQDLLEFFERNIQMEDYKEFRPILEQKLLQTDNKKRLWGKELPKAADDAQLKKCFGISHLRKVLHLYY